MDLPPSSSLPNPVLPAAPSSDERTWAVLAHVGPILIGFLAPLIILFTKGNESAYVRRHAVESLNFNLTLMGAIFISAVLTVVLIGCVMLVVVLGAALVLQILAAVKANAGGEYRYPATIRLIT